jgi:hypothetical protein
MFTGGFAKYREYCAAAAADGYRNFTFEPMQGAMAAPLGLQPVGEGV